MSELGSRCVRTHVLKLRLTRADLTCLQFEVRFAPALAKKPTDQGKGEQKGERRDAPPDPFAPPYQQDLYVAEDVVKEDEHDAGEGFVVLVSCAFSSPSPTLPPLPLKSACSCLSTLPAAAKA